MGRLKENRSPEQDEADTKVEISGGDLDVREESGFYEAYAGFARSLRTWFVAFGVGAPVLILTTEDALSLMRDSGLSGQIAMAFLGGVLVQIVAAMLYKSAMWFLYVGELKPDFRSSTRHKVSDFLSESYIVEIGLDIVTLGLFAWATLMALLALT